MREFILGLASGMILLLVGQCIARACRKQDIRSAVLDDIANQYHDLRKSKKDSGAHGLIQSGIYRVTSSQEIEKVVARIQELGHSDPLHHNRAALKGKDIYHFFLVLQNNQLNPLQNSNLQTTYELTKDADLLTRYRPISLANM